MSRPAPTDIQASDNGWEAVFNEVAEIIRDAPFPVHEHTGDETDLQSTFAAATHDRCLVWVNDTGLGWTLYYSDGTAWAPFEPGGSRGSSTFSGTYNMVDTDEFLFCSNNSAGTVNLVAAADYEGKTIWIGSVGVTNVITISPDGSETINGEAGDFFLTGYSYKFASLYSDGTEWYLVSTHLGGSLVSDTNHGNLRSINAGGCPSVDNSITSSTSTIGDHRSFQLHVCTNNSVAQTITLPDRATNEGETYWFKRTGTGGTVTVQRAGSDTIDGGTSIALAAQYDWVLLRAGASEWMQVGGNV